MDRRLTIKRTQRTSMLIILFTLCISQIALADGGNVFTDFLTEAAKFFPNVIGNALVAIGVKTENIFLPGSPFMFSFSQSNIFGIFTAKAYPIFKTIAIIMVSPTLGFIAYDMLWSTTSERKKDSYDKLKVLVIAVIALWFLPDILNIILNIKDKLVLGMNEVFASGNDGFVEAFQETAHSGNLLDSIIFLAATIFSFWLMFNYLGLSFGFAVLLLYTPIALITTPAKFGKKVFGEITKDFVGFCITPMLDITLLGIVYVIRGAAVNATSLGMSELLYNIMSIGLIMMVIPTRSKLKQKLGMGSALGDALGAGLAVGTMAMMMRGAKRGKANPGQSMAGGMEGDSESTQEKADYYNDLDNMENESPIDGDTSGGATQSESMPGSDSGISGHESIDEMDFVNTPKGQFAYNNMDKSYYNERDIGGLSHSEKASVLKAKANNQREQEELDRKKGFKQKVVKGTLSTYGTAVGMGAGMFFGSKGVAVGGMIGNKLGSAAGDKISSKIVDKHALWDNGEEKLQGNVIQAEGPEMSYGMSTDVEMSNASVNMEESEVNIREADVDFNSASPNFNFADPNVNFNTTQTSVLKEGIRSVGDQSKNTFTTRMESTFSDYKDVIRQKGIDAIEKNPLNATTIQTETTSLIETAIEAERETVSTFIREASKATEQLSAELSKRLSGVAESDMSRVIQDLEEDLKGSLMQAQGSALDASEKAGVDLREYMSSFLDTSKVY